MGVKFTEEFIKAADGYELYTATWEPEGKIVATVTAIHGLGEHICRYSHVFNKFAEAGVKVQGVDQRGFGRTLKPEPGKVNGAVGHVEGSSFQKVIDDHRAVTKRIRIAGVKHFVFGHSMGGVIALTYAASYPEDMDGIVSSGAAIKNFTPYITTVAAKGLAKLIPSVSLSNGLDDLDALSHDPQCVKDYKEDPYVHGYISFGTAAAIFSAGPSLIKNATSFKVPILITHGGSDKMTNSEGSKEFYEAITVQDKTLKIFEGLYHECHNELSPAKEETIQNWLDWIVKRA